MGRQDAHNGKGSYYFMDVGRKGGQSYRKENTPVSGQSERFMTSHHMGVLALHELKVLNNR